MAQKYCCKACDYVYNPQKGDREGGVAPGVAFEDLPENWICPEWGVGKGYFEPVGVKEDEDHIKEDTKQIAQPIRLRCFYDV